MASPNGPEFGLALPLDATSIVCLSLGVVIVALHSMKKFEESTVEKSEDDFIAQLLPKYLATRGEYSRALVRYMGSMIGILCALSAIGPRLLEILGPAVSAYAPVAPLGFALRFWSGSCRMFLGFRTLSGGYAASGTSAHSFLRRPAPPPTCCAPPVSIFPHTSKRPYSRRPICEVSNYPTSRLRAVRSSRDGRV